MPIFDDKTWSKILKHKYTELGPPATAKAIAVFEARHRFALPEAHREFLLRANGGIIVGVIKLFGVGRRDSLDLGRQLKKMRPKLEATSAGPVFPFACDGGDNYLCYDLRKPAMPSGYPVLMCHNEYSEKPADRYSLWVKFTRNFRGFIKYIIEVQA